ncbi:thermonuclease family protein [Patescibacteria group bacterium]|nr:thermonuclease family protein [Patescibacteria group bacterium]
MKTATVKRVRDGDTFEIENDAIRLENVDAPEINTEDGKICKDKLEELILGEEVEYTEEARDDFGRLVARVWVEGKNVNKAMNDFIEGL